MIDLSSSGASEAHRNETFTSHLDIDSKVTTFNTNGTVASVVGTQTWDRTATGTLSWDHDLAQTEVWSWYDPWTEMSATVTTVDQQASESYVNNGSWSKNLATNVPTTISSTLLTTGSHQFHLTHDEYVGTPTEGYLDYENPYDRESTYSYNWSASLPGISGEHGFAPTDLLSMEQQGVLPGSTGWDVGAQGNPEDFGNEEPEPVTYEEPPPETEDQPETWMHFATGFIPVYGSARDMYESYNKGQYGWMVFHGAMLAVDLTGVGALGKMGGKALFKFGAAGVKALARSGIREMAEKAVKSGMQKVAGAADNLVGKMWDDAAEGAGKISQEVTERCGKFADDGLTEFCFPAGTPVSTEHGSRSIETLKVGERVWAYHHARGEWALRPILKTSAPVQENFLELQVAGETIRVTEHHPFWIVRGEELGSRPQPEHVPYQPDGSRLAGRWVDSADLRVGDVLFLQNGGEAAITSLSRFEERQPVYNFAVEDLHSYAVGNCGVLVHNNCGDEAKILRKNMGSAAEGAERAHHIVPSGHPEADAARRLLADHNIHFNDAINGVGLTKVQHSGMKLHTKASIKSVTQRLRDAIEGIDDVFERQAALMNTLVDIRQLILSGVTP